MKLIYIIGLEHSGTTLTDHLLSQHPGVMGLGEVAEFFDAAHMKEYERKWGTYADAKLCSCGSSWEQCDFWSKSVDLCGDRNPGTVGEKYITFCDRIRRDYGDEITIVDSSKRLDHLQFIGSNLSQLKLNASDVSVVFCCKDVRSFTASIGAKTKVAGFVATLRTFNWWLGFNRKVHQYLETSGVRYTLSLYENMCRSPEAQIRRMFETAGLSSESVAAADLKHTRSHIALGNKNFTMRNRERIAYDGRWFTNDTINAAYMLHVRARAFNRRLYQIADSGQK